MSDAKTPEKPSADKQVESPTTARPIDFDDDQQESGIVGSDGTETPTKPPRSSSLKPDRNVHFQEGDEAPPPKPPRPNSPNTENMTTLKEAFPDVDPKVIHAVLIASSGQVEPAFNALLAMSDPNFKDELPPPQPPRPQQTRQEQQDEMYARQLAEHYRSQAQPPPPGGPRPSGRQAQRRPGDEDEHEYSFFDDDLPEIRQQISKGFRDTQNTINKWVSNFRKTIDGEDSDDDDPRTGSSAQPPRQNFGPRQSDQLRGIQQNAEHMRSSSARRSTDRERYDADPRVLSDNFNELELRDDDVEERPPPKPARPLANPDLFKPTPALPSGPVDEVEALYEHPAPGSKSTASPAPPSTGKSKKWQPLTSVAPAPVDDADADADADDDPFKLNSDDEEDDKAKKEDLLTEDTQRLKAAAEKTRQASESKDGAAGADGDKLEMSEHQRTGSVGTRDKIAEDLVKGDDAK